MCVMTGRESALGTTTVFFAGEQQSRKLIVPVFVPPGLLKLVSSRPPLYYTTERFKPLVNF